MKNTGKKSNALAFDKQGYQIGLTDLNGTVLPDPETVLIRPLRGGVRAGAGRKPAGRQAMLFRLKPETAERLRAAAKRTGKTLSDLAEARLAGI
jgi:hypothetical protein